LFVRVAGTPCALIAEAIGVLCRHERVRIGGVRRSAIPSRG